MKEKISRRAVLAALAGLGGVSVGSYYFFGRGDPTVRLWLIRIINYGPAVSVDLELLKNGELVLDDTYHLPSLQDSINPYLRDYPYEWDISDVNPRRITPTWGPSEANYRVRYRLRDQSSWNEFTFENVNFEHVALTLSIDYVVRAGDGHNYHTPRVIQARTMNLRSASHAQVMVENSTLPESPDSEDL
ncbi:hypothetical protein [Halococcoides cellulosivorans]|uniref:Uncharacterized protein n=1 Tax=Halococcoides cellulosivorans TaxID=1679096 RepID=A0A2R4X404_9EURY|nr:hypothetical protein [Halococcoides cellulosivorans]AWB28531.1 hypothetical protein HARCEL1_12990 [Halococcoides cellulosivorans]